MNIVLPEDESYYRLAGCALAASQVFERIFVIAAKLAIQQGDADTLEEIVPLSASRSFKQPIKAIVQELSKVQAISPELENRFAELIESRHKLVHRAFAEYGWPLLENDEAAAKFRDLCKLIISESTELTQLLHKVVLAWMLRFPETAVTVKKHQEQFGITTDEILLAATQIVQG
jgi:hypothetical protein